MLSTVPEAYLAVAVMALVGIGFPVLSFVGSGFWRPRKTGNDANKLSSWLLPGYESDQSLYVRRESTTSVGMIQLETLISISISNTTGTQ